MEWTLQQQGFDLCYDKRLYDRLVHESAESVRGHLAGRRRLPGAPAAVHREPRRAARGGDVRAGAGARRRRRRCPTLQGARLVHDGQLEGRRTRIPVFLGRGPDEPPDEDLRAFYAPAAARRRRQRPARPATGGCATCEGWPDNDSHRRLVAWCWRRADARHLVVVNLSDAPGAGARAPAVGRPRGPAWKLTDRLGGAAVRPRRRRDGGRRPVRRARRLGVALPRVRARRLNAGQRLTAGRCRTAGGGGAARPRRAPAPPPRAATACARPSRSASR